MIEILYTLIIFPLVQILEFFFFFSQKLFKETGISIVFISAVISILCLPNDTQFALNPAIDYLVHDNIFEPDNWTPASSKK
jgi:hypothetical protein